MIMFFCMCVCDGGGGVGSSRLALELIGNPQLTPLRTEQIVECSSHPSSFECFGILLRWLPRSDF